MATRAAHPANRVTARRNWRLALDGDDAGASGGEGSSSDNVGGPLDGRPATAAKRAAAVVAVAGQGDRGSGIGHRRGSGTGAAAALAAAGPVGAVLGRRHRPAVASRPLEEEEEGAMAAKQALPSCRSGAASSRTSPSWQPETYCRRDTTSGTDHSRDATARTATGPPDMAGKRKRREYAWMDSGDEAASSAGEGADGESGDSNSLGDERQIDAEPTRVSEVETLAQMLRFVPRLRRSIGTMPPMALVEVIVAASRVRFYDAEFFDELLPELRTRLRKRSSTFSTREMVDCIAALQELNAYDVVIFSAVTRALKHRVNELDAAQRRRILTVLKTANHTGDSELVTLLVQREKQEAEVQQAMRQAADYLVMRSPGQLRPCRF